ncbi:MAG: hypothetical protein Dbin4_03135 [Alphaproteobacteria bacterium]|nr:hypothetical protein [Alphaproteobacteria bacterium]
MKLIHYSDKPLGKILSVQQHDLPGFKPKGLWVSIDDNGEGWRDWCVGESFNLDRLTYATQIILSETAKILHLSKAEEIDDLTIRYGQRSKWRSTYIKWQELAVNCDGIIIAPYCWERRLCDHASWYYGWDCASGCIWNAAAIKEALRQEEGTIK